MSDRVGLSDADCYNCAGLIEQMTRFIVCPSCGNKRCPKATYHELPCSGSNELGQPGSRFQ